MIDKIDISLIKLSPEILTGNKEFTENFFSKIDEIEDLISNNIGINEIAQNYNIKIQDVNKYSPNENNDDLLNEIYKNRNQKKLDLIDKNDYFLLYEIKNLKEVLPSLEDNEFIKLVKNDLYESSKYDTNKDLITKIEKKQFTNEDFKNLTNGNINKLKINSINDVKKFTADSVTLLYSLGLNSFSLVSDDKNNVYLVKIKKIIESNLDKSNQDLKSFVNKTNAELRDNLYNSYDLLLNDKYNIEINQKTLDRTKNYFR